MELFFKVIAWYSSHRMLNMLQKYQKLDTFFKVSNKIKLVILPGNKKLLVWKTNFVEINVHFVLSFIFKCIFESASEIQQTFPYNVKSLLTNLSQLTFSVFVF